MPAYHLRYTVVKQHQPLVADKIVELWKPTKYYFGSETSKKGVEHLQCHLEFDEEPPNKDKRSKDYKKIDEELGLGPGLKYFSIVNTDARRNLIYCAKECSPIKHSLDEDELEELHAEETEINEDKKKDIKVKLIEAVQQELSKMEKPKMTFNDVCLIIMELYIDKYDKLPPHRGLMFQYVMYVSWKLGLALRPDFEYAYDI